MFDQTRDPVCGMKVRERKAAAIAEYEGEIYYFCSVSCQQTFLEHPAKYAVGEVESHRPVGGCCCHH